MTVAFFSASDRPAKTGQIPRWLRGSDRGGLTRARPCELVIVVVSGVADATLPPGAATSGLSRRSGVMPVEEKPDADGSDLDRVVEGELQSEVVMVPIRDAKPAVDRPTSRDFGVPVAESRTPGGLAGQGLEGLDLV